MSLLIARRDLTQDLADVWTGRSLAMGKVDCGRMLGAHARAFGHATKLLRFGAYHDAAGARRALVKMGCATLADAVRLHGHLEIPAARSLIGDVVALRSDDGLGALGVVLGVHLVLMFRAGVCQPCRVQPAFYEAANLLGCWRLDLTKKAYAAWQERRKAARNG